MPKQSVTVKRDPIFYPREFRIISTTNTTKPTVGQSLSEQEVGQLIASGVTVKII